LKKGRRVSKKKGKAAMTKQLLVMESSDDFEARLEKLVKDETITKAEGRSFWMNFTEDKDVLRRLLFQVGKGNILQLDAEARWEKYIESRPKLPTTPKTKKGGKSVGIDWLIWPLAFGIWLFTESALPWVIAIALRAWIWYTKERGKDQLVGVYQQKVPKTVRESLASSVSNSASIWLIKAFVLLIVVLNLFQVSGLVGFIALIGTIILLRIPGKPHKMKDGSLILPRPFLRILLGYFSGIFQSANQVGKSGVKLGFKFLMLDKRSNFIVAKINQIDVNDSLVGWCLGSVDLIIKDGGGNTAHIKVARWDNPDKMENQIRFAVGMITEEPPK